MLQILISLRFRLRRLREISASTWGFAGTGLDGVILLGMEGVAFDVEGCHFGVADSEALFIGVGVEFASGLSGRSSSWSLRSIRRLPTGS